MDSRTIHLVEYLLNLSLLNEKFLNYKSKEILAGCFVLARKMLKDPNLVINRILFDFSVVKKDIEIIAKMLLFMLRDGYAAEFDGDVLDACKRKFASPEYDCVSDIEVFIVER